MTQAELGERLDVPQSMVAYVESGMTQPSEAFLTRLSLQTGFPPAFFRTDPIDFPAGSLLYRSRASMTAKEKARARRQGQLAFELSARLSSRVSGLPLRLPRLAEPPGRAAAITRTAMGLSPDTPIPHLVRAVERAGVVVLILPTELKGGDAFSAWAGEEQPRPVIAIADGAPPDRQRFSVAHELGHLVMHQALRGSVREIEQEADAFASELLLPAESMRREIPDAVTLSSLVPLKRRWGVSLQALIRRARDLKIITERRYRYLFEQLSRKGWRTDEPDSAALPVERPRALRKMAELLYGEPIDVRRLAADLAIAEPFARDVLERYAARSEMPRRTHKTAEPPARLIAFPDGAEQRRSRHRG